MKKIILLANLILVTFMVTFLVGNTYATTEEGYIYEDYNITEKFLDTGLPQDAWSGTNYWGKYAESPLSSDTDKNQALFSVIVPIKVLYDRDGNPVSGAVQSDHDYYQIKTFETPNYVVYPNGVIQTGVFDKVILRFYTAKGLAQGNRTYDVELTNYGPGGRSKFYLESPIIIPSDSTISYVGVLYYTSSEVKSQIVNNTNQNIIGDTTAKRLQYFIGSITASYSHAYVETRDFLKNNNFKSTVIVSTRSEWNPPTTPDEFDTLDDLPSYTNGSVYSNTNGMGKVTFLVDENNITARVKYDVDNNTLIDENEEWFVKFTMSTNTDMSIFDSRYEVFYYVYEGQKYFLINHGTTSMFTSRNVKTQTWVDYTVWNLTTNEINTFERFNVYMYTKLEEANNAYAYFYADEFIIENLLSVSLSMRYRYTYLIGNPGEWKDYQQVLEAGVISKVDPTSWQADFLSTTAVATTVLSFIPGVRWPALIVGTSVMAYLGSTVQTSLVSYGDISQIQKIVPTNTLVSELNKAYLNNYPNFSGLNSNMPVFKLHLGQFNETFSTGIDIDPEFNAVGNQKGLNIIQFTYMTEGQVYTIDGEDINLIFTPGQGTDGNNPNIPIPDIDVDLPLMIAGGLFVVIVVMGVLNHKGGISRLGLDGLFKIIIIGLVVALLVYFMLPLIISQGLNLGLVNLRL